MRDLLKIDKCQRMLYLRLFLCLNAYPEITADSFNDNSSPQQFSGESDSSSGVPSARVTHDNYEGQPMLMGQDLLDNPANVHLGMDDHHQSLLRDSQDINSIAMSSMMPSMQNTIVDETLAFGGGADAGNLLLTNDQAANGGQLHIQRQLMT